MRRAQIIIVILLAIVIGLLIYVKKDDVQNVQEVASDKIVQNENVQVTFLDIGQGDATFIEFPNGEQMLVDCAIDARIIEALGRVMDFYDRDLDYLLVTHPDLDHYGGCVDVLRRFDVSTIAYNGAQKPADAFWRVFWQSVKDENAEYVEIDSPMTWTIASTTVAFLYPDHSIKTDARVPGNSKDTGDNNASIVMKISYGDSDIILPGDAESELETYLIKRYGAGLDVEVLKAAHHGSGGSSIQPFIDMVTPVETVFSAGKENKYGHPSLRVIRRTERAGSRVWRTDTMGDIVLLIKKDGLVARAVFGH